MTESSNQHSTGRIGPWVVAAVVTATVAGSIDAVSALWTSTGSTPLAALMAWLAFVSLWSVTAVGWAVLTGGLLWAATGRFGATPQLVDLIDTLRRWYRQRHDEDDAIRCANVLTGLSALLAWSAASIGLTTHLIEAHELAWLIAATSLAGQLALAVGIAVVSVAIRRLLTALFLARSDTGRLRWLHLPTMLAALALSSVATLVAAAVIGRDIFWAIEGPALVLGATAIVVHPVVAYLIETRRWTPDITPHVLWAAPLVALLGIGVGTHHSDARRIVVLHGDAAQFAYHPLQERFDVHRLLSRDDCPPLGEDGRPVDGMSHREYSEQCIDPDYDRPFARSDTPTYERPSFERRPSFVFITWDSVRVDRLGFMGHHRDTTPHLDRLADDSLVFDRAFTQDSGTGPSFWSLMAGKTPFQVDLVDGHSFPPPIADDEAMLGDVLADAGYHNEAVMCGSVFDRQDWAIRRGFARFDNVCDDQLSQLAPLVADAGIDTVERLAADDEPFCLWLHFYDPHHPYNDHPDIGYGTDRLDRYDEELTYTDRHFGRVMETIDSIRGDYDRPLYTIVGADHGENFGEHGTDPHARNLYRIVTQVPKLVDGPHISPRRIDSPVAFNDIYPSVLELAGIDIPDESTMVSQVPVYFGAEPDDQRMVFQENSYSRPRRHTRAVVYGRYHYIMDLTTHTSEMYDYIDDPLERRNLAGTGLPEERIMRQALYRFLQTSQIPEGLEN